LEQLLELLDAVAAPDQLVERLQAAVELVAAGRLEMSDQQQAVVSVQYKVVQTWVKRQRGDKVAGAVAVLLGVLGV
jgi:hypothetical protein